VIDSPSSGSLRTRGGLPRLRHPHRPAIHWAAGALVLGLAACGGNDNDAPAAVTDLAINAAGAINFSYTASGSFPVLGATRFQVNTPQALSIGFESGTATGSIKVTGSGGSTQLLQLVLTP